MRGWCHIYFILSYIIRFYIYFVSISESFKVSFFPREIKFQRLCLGMIFNHPSSSVTDRSLKYEFCLCLGEILFFISLITYFLYYLYSPFLEMTSERCIYPESILHFFSRFLTIFYFYSIAVNCRCPYFIFPTDKLPIHWLFYFSS